MSRSTLLAFVLTLLVSSIGGAQKPAPGNPDDALLASPANFKLLFENEYVRVVEYVVQPGQQDQWHTHPAKVSYVAEGGALRISTASSAPLSRPVASSKDGQNCAGVPLKQRSCSTNRMPRENCSA